MRLLASAVFLSLAAGAVPAQQQMPVGARVRVTIHEDFAQMETRTVRGQMLRGVLERVNQDTLFVRPSPTVGPVAIPYSAVLRLDRSRGTPSRLWSAVTGAVGGGILFAVEAAILYNTRYSFSGSSRGDAALRGAGVGAITFGIIGFAFPVERWRRVPLD